MEFNENLMSGRASLAQIRATYRKYPGMRHVLRDGPARNYDLLTLYFLVAHNQVVAEAAGVWTMGLKSEKISCAEDFLVDVFGHTSKVLEKGDSVTLEGAGMVFVPSYGMKTSFFFMDEICAHKWCSDKLILSHVDNICARERAVILTAGGIR